MIDPWKLAGSRPLGDFRIFKLRADRRVSPLTGTEHEFIIIDAPHWVNVIAVTPGQQLVMVEQFRYGSETVELEIPGGIIDPGDVNPVEAGLRELREETGYEGRDARLLAQVWSNPAIMNNRTYTVLVEHCECRHPTEFDSGEELVTRLVPVADISQLLASGKIQHPLVQVALSQYELFRQANSGKS